MSPTLKNQPVKSSTLKIGYVAKAHGIHGELMLKFFDSSSTAIEEVERVVLEKDGQPARTYDLVNLRETTKECLVRLNGVSSRDASEALVGSTVLVFRDDLEPPDEGEFFSDDLVGLRAVTPEGRVLGEVKGLWDTGPVPNVVIAAGTEELLVPFVDDFVKSIDLKGGVMIVVPPAYE